jgi:hypothetical protein
MRCFGPGSDAWRFAVQMTCGDKNRFEGRVVMNKFMVLSLVGVLLWAGMAGANVYRCVSDDGTVRFSDQPCADDAELFIKEEGCDIDDRIRRAYPFKDLSLKSDDISDRLSAHARKLASCILPSKNYKSYNVSESHFRDKYHDWNVTVEYKDSDGKGKWSLIFYYDVPPEDRTRRVHMSAIIVRYLHGYHDLPLLENINSLSRRSKGKYSVELQ